MEPKNTFSTSFLIISLFVIIVALVMVLLNRFRPNDHSPKPIVQKIIITHGKTIPSFALQQQIPHHVTLMHHMMTMRTLDMMHKMGGSIENYSQREQRLRHIHPANQMLEYFYE